MKRSLDYLLTAIAMALLPVIGCHSSPQKDDGNNSDADTDTDTDTTPDTETDTDTEPPGVDTSPIQLWEGCPNEGDYQGNDTWTSKMNVSNQALFCSYPEDGPDEDPMISLKMTYADKGQLRSVPGSYPVPANSSTESFLLPMCYRNAAGEVYASKDTGTLEVQTIQNYVEDPVTGESPMTDIQLYMHHQEMKYGDSDTMEMEVSVEYIDYTSQSPGAVNITGRYVETYLAPITPSFVRLYTPTQTTEGRWQRFYPCLFFDLASTPHIYKVTFDGGEIQLDVDIESDLPESSGTEPYSFVHAFGKLSDTDFDQKDYWKLIYAPEHHHFTRHFAVLFDSDIGAACGLMVTGIDPFSDPPETGVEVHTIDCNVDPVDAKTVQTVERLY